MTAARRHDPEASRAAILDAAQALFLERGFAGTSMSEVAKASGVTKSLIHHHFGSKDQLWQEVKHSRFAAYYDRQIELFGRLQPTPDLIRESMRVYFRFLQESPQMLRMMWWMLLSDEQEGNEMMNELRDLGVQRIEAAQSEGLLRRDIAPTYILMAFLGLVHAWFTEKWLSDADECTADDYLAAAWQIFAAGVLPR